MLVNKLSVSVVTYNNTVEEITLLLNSLLSSTVKCDIFVVDNSENSTLEQLVKTFANVHYYKMSKNIGFGAGHNFVLKKTTPQYKYHLAINPDVFFEPTVLEALLQFMDAHPEVGNVMPKVLNLDSSIQYACRQLPKPMDLFGRRFLPKSWMLKRNERYEMRESGYDAIMEVPFLSGCFMLLRTSVLQKVGLFDERYFLYFEDIDLNRRIQTVAKTLFYPSVSIFHAAKHQSYRDRKLTLIHIKSAIQYFNKFGWFPFF